MLTVAQMEGRGFWAHGTVIEIKVALGELFMVLLRYTRLQDRGQHVQKTGWGDLVLACCQLC